MELLGRLWRELGPIIRDAFCEVFGELIGWALALLAVGIPLLLILYFALKKRGVRFTFRKAPGSGRANFEFQRLEPEVHRLGHAEINKAAQLQNEGKDLETICREVYPGYSEWDSFRQQAFRSAMEEVLKTPRPPASSGPA